MSVYADTTALYALLDRSDSQHVVAGQIWMRLLADVMPLVTTNYVLLETFALVQRRLGLEAIDGLMTAIVPLLSMVWIDSELHQAGLSALLTANRRDLSLVDCVSFELCRRRSIRAVFAFDSHFSEQGFHLLSDGGS